VSTAAAPFASVMRSSAGREGGAQGVDQPLQCKYLAVRV
jgi:acyl-CoA reductase-like NAD-dependent aldehyde dehydrogenase